MKNIDKESDRVMEEEVGEMVKEEVEEDGGEG